MDDAQPEGIDVPVSDELFQKPPPVPQAHNPVHLTDTVCVGFSSEIEHRHEFGLLCNWRRLYRAIEIGTDKGSFAKSFLDDWKGYWLLCVDPYLPYDDMPWDRDAQYAAAKANLAQHAERATLIKMTSEAFIAKTKSDVDWQYKNIQLEFAYIDGDHSYEAVCRDMDLIWPIITDIGIMAGHDFHDAHPGVVRAVTEFAVRHGCTVYLTHDTPSSWYIYKNPPAANWNRIPVSRSSHPMCLTNSPDPA